MTNQELADMLWEAERSGKACEPLTARDDDFDVERAYEVQGLNIARRLEGEGLHGRPAQLVGRKVGLTSHAIQDWLGVDEPDFGALLDDMIADDGAAIDMDRLVQPRAEAELAFVLDRPLEGPGITPARVIRATGFILPAIEIIDSRIANWDIEYADTIADNASSAMFVLGNRPVSLDEAGDLRLAGMTLRKNGRVVSTGAGAACLGHPVHAVAWLANKLAAFDTALEPGEIILSGALGPAVDVEAGDAVDADIARVGSVRGRFA
ncbi:MAG: 2-keto-4-pentenoate hydratase [Persicimonas sp.]